MGPTDEDTLFTITKTDLTTGYTHESMASLNILALSATDGVITTSDSANGPWIFGPVQDFEGTVTLTYVVSDGNVGGLVATNSFTVSPINDKPVMTSGAIATLTVLEDGSITSMGLSSLAFDTGGGTDEDSQTLSYAAVTVPTTAGTIYKSDEVTVVSAGTALTLSGANPLSI